ncbi:MAG: squalene--hopene cyclase [Proteobacteria bacterium]|nr:squalene--hopene cyclase [Pseudomonadota bacterium]
MQAQSPSSGAPQNEQAPSSASVDQAVERTQQWLQGVQQPEGFWCAELQGDTILESEYAMLIYFLEHRVTEKMHLLAEYLRRHQHPDGGWVMYPDGPVDVSASVKAYFILKLVGDSPDAPHMERARQVILRKGGVTACNSFTKFGLSMFGQYEWAAVPAIPPEIILLPNSAYFNIYAMSSWSRAMVITMAIIWHHKPVVPVPANARIDELFVGGRDLARMKMRFSDNLVSWRNFFLTVDRVLKVVEGLGVRPFRDTSLRRCKAWMVEHMEKSGGVGAIFPPMVNTVMVLHLTGHASDDPLMRQAMAEVEALEIREGDTLRMQPCFSPVWDTALTSVCVQGAGLAGDHPSMQRAARWFLDREVKQAADVHRYRRNMPIGGWYFEYANEFYPDVDDTTMVLMGLDTIRLPEGDDERRVAAIRRGVDWMMAMQCRNGGWAAFDVDNDRQIFTHVPFADHNAMLDPPTADITARVLEALGRLGTHSMADAPVQRAIAFLQREQEPDGCWYGRWGVNYIYGTWQVLRGLEAIGADMRQSWVQAGATWLREHQNPDGGWGETADSYEFPKLRGQGPSTASQTAWALMGIMSAGDYDSDSVRRGIDYLVRTQCADGTWNETWWTGTGFPRVFYLKYHYYCIYFPLYALGMYQRRDNLTPYRKGRTQGASTAAPARG